MPDIHRITMRKVFDAPRETVWRAWTDPAHMSWYYNPDHAVPGPITVDLRVGGQWRVPMVIDSETTYMTGGVYREIDPPTRLVYAFGAVDGWPEIDLDDLDAAPTVTLAFREEGRRTVLDFDLIVPDAKFHPFMEQGFSETIDRLVAVYRGQRAGVLRNLV